jgi:hypothetical protein
MKSKIIIIIVLVFLWNNAQSQNDAKNIIRVGVGANFSDHVSGEKYSAGPALEAEYQRTLSKYIGVTVNISAKMLHYGENHDGDDITGAIGTMITPLPDKFRWIKIGVGFGLRYMVNPYAVMEGYYDEDHMRCYPYIYVRESKYVPGFHFVGRLYAIDNAKYELFASYRLKTSFNHGIEMNNGILSLCFGVKF